MSGLLTHVTRRHAITSNAALALAYGTTALGAAACGTRETSPAPSVAPATIGFASLYKEDPSWQLSKRQLADFEAKHPTIKVQPDWITGATTDYLAKVQTYFAAGSYPDVMYIHLQQTPIFGALGVCLDLAKHAQSDRSFAVNDVVQAVYDFFWYKGKPIGIPWYSGPHVVLFNRTLFQSLGVKTPDEYEKEGKWTWETMREVALRLTRGTPGSADRTVGMQADTLPRLTAWQRWVWQAGSDLYSRDRTRAQFTTPEAVAAFTYVADLILKDRSVVYRETLGTGSAFGTGRVGMQFAVARDGMTVPVDAARANGFQLGHVPLPKGKAGRQNLDGPQAYGIASASKAPDAAWKLVRWWADETPQAERLQLAASVPVRKSMLKHKSFVDYLRPWESAAVLEEALNTVRVAYIAANTPDQETVVNAAWNGVLAGERSVKDALDQMQAQVDPLLKGV
jgi:multiple sugar transport system substrate-binding protein